MIQTLLGVNWLAVIIAAIVSMVIGFVWYTVFGKQWTAFTGWTQEKVKALPQNQMMMSYGLAFVGAFLQALVLAALFNELQVKSIQTALVLGALVWVGFTAAPSLANFAFEHRPWGLFGLQNGLYLVYALVNSIILVLMRTY